MSRFDGWPVDPAEWDPDVLRAVKALAEARWRRKVVFARRRHDRALLLLEKDDDGDYALKAGSESRWWTVEDPWPEGEPTVARYSVVTELDAPAGGGGGER